jgi:hypothetical protein
MGSICKYFVLFVTHFFTNPIKATCCSACNSHFNHLHQLRTELNQVFQITFRHSAKNISQRSPLSITMAVFQSWFMRFSEISSFFSTGHVCMGQNHLSEHSIWSFAKFQFLLNCIAFFYTNFSVFIWVYIIVYL